MNPLECGRINITVYTARQIAHVLETDSRGLFRGVRTGRVKYLRRLEGVVTGAIPQNAVSGQRVKEFRINSLTPMTPEPEAACSGMAPRVRIAWRELHRPLRIGNPNA